MKHFFLGACALLSLAPIALAQTNDEFARSWRGVARVETLRKIDKKREISASYPVFQTQNSLTRVAGAALKREALASFNAAVKESTDPDSQMPDGLKFADEWKSRLVYRTPRLLSVETLSYSFRGGAHGMYGTSGQVFGIPTAQKLPRRLKLADFFFDGKRSAPHVNALLMKKLRATKGTNQVADWVLDGTVKSITALQLENFVAQKNGLKWLFSPYEMGPYAAGEFEVSLLTKELGPTFAPEC
jgi:hypothetical protein